MWKSTFSLLRLIPDIQPRLIFSNPLNVQPNLPRLLGVRQASSSPTQPKIWNSRLSLNSLLTPTSVRLSENLSGSNICVVPVRHRTPGLGFVHCSMSRGKKEPDQEVLKRFYRLDWGGWIKRIAGSSKRVWKMQRRVRRKREYHVFVSKTYANKFDRMVTREYREPKYYVDDIYAPYHRRNNLDYPYYIPKQEITISRLQFPELNPDTLAQRRTAAISAAAASPAVQN